MKSIIQRTGSFLLLFFMQFSVWAQETKKVDIDLDVNKGDSNWYQQPWVWIVGIAVFILLLVALLKGGGKKD
jgi:hypothetical protein